MRYGPQNVRAFFMSEPDAIPGEWMRATDSGAEGRAPNQPPR
jgi:hypothetical protein